MNVDVARLRCGTEYARFVPNLAKRVRNAFQAADAAFLLEVVADSMKPISAI